MTTTNDDLMVRLDAAQGGGWMLPGTEREAGEALPGLERAAAETVRAMRAPQTRDEAAPQPVLIFNISSYGQSARELVELLRREIAAKGL